MKIGCPKEIKPQEFRVGMTPDAAREAINHGHEVMIETKAGLGAGYSDADYATVGAAIVEAMDSLNLHFPEVSESQRSVLAEARKRLTKGGE